MRRRIRQPYKVLSVTALAVLPACSRPDAAAETDKGAGAALTAPAATPAATPSPSTAGRVPPPAPDPAKDPERFKLVTEISRMPLSDAMKEREHFRPLCDADGYPLVGNLPTKSPASAASDGPVATFCAEQRKMRGS